ncbi:MAG TPA: amidophosphoribosyltransferase [Acidimicrobiales bacterium]|nr:amidophosphoribosyltransferase [Acidimicrobiales bacterium]
MCGVVGIHAPGEHVSHLAYLSLYALQHRGQEAAGMAVSDGQQLTVVKDQGLVSNAFDDRTLQTLQGYLAVGHTRYSTTGSSTWRNAQPVWREVGGRQLALGHNGNLTNTAQLAEDAGMLPGLVTSDSDLLVELIGHELERMGEELSHDDVERAVLAVLPKLQGAFSLVIADEERLIAVRDPHGFRPLCLGKLESGWVIASETPALDIAGATFVRELDPGEVVIIDGTSPPRSVRPWPEAAIDPKLCIFEFFYFARPDSRLYGHSVHAARVRMGELLAEQAPAQADMVMGVPESGIAAAEGFARASGIPYGQGLVKNRYIGRSFIAPTPELRRQAVKLKLNPLRENIAGKRLVVVDDSIVRGTTQQQLTRMLREAGAAEIHLRITSPPVRWPCFYGIDIGERAELLAAQLDTIEEIRNYVGVDTLAYLTLDGLLASTGVPGGGFCHACFTGEYPVEVPVGLGKAVLESPDRAPAGALEQLAHLPIAGQD